MSTLLNFLSAPNCCLKGHYFCVKTLIETMRLATNASKFITVVQADLLVFFGGRWLFLGERREWVGDNIYSSIDGFEV